jgi:WD40 repeat protein
VLPKLLLIVSVVAVAFALYTFRHMVIAPEGLLLSLDGHEEEVDILSWSPDGRLLASAGAMTFSGESNTVRIWDARKGTMLHSFSQDHAHVQGLVFSQDGKTLAVVHAKTVRFIRLPSGSMTGITDADVPGMKEGDFGISQVALSPDGNLCGVAHDGVSLYDVNTGEVLRRHDKAAGERAPTLAFADNGELRFACSTSDSVIVRRMTREGVRQLATGVIPGAAFPFASMRLSSDARVLVYDDDARMVIMDARDGRSIREIANPCGWRSASGVGFSRDNARAIALRGQDSIRIVGLNPPSGPVSRLIPPGSGVSGIALSPDGERCAAISGHDQTCGLYSIGPHAPEPVRELVHRDGFRSPVNRVRRAAFSPDGSMLATANHALKIWSGKK